MLKLVVLSCVLAAATASVVGIAPLGYSAPLGYAAPLAYSASLAYGAPLGLASSNYRGPLSLAPGQPANILGADGRPLDTLDVNLDRSAHLVAKALDGGVHLLKKRSVIAPFAYGASLAYSAPLAYSTPLLAPSNYRGPLSLAPGQPANILAADGRPLDTLDVNLDRSAHYVAKALNSGVHLLKKRSAPLIAPIAPIASHVALAPTPLITPASPILGRVAPISHLAPYSAYSAYSSYASPYAYHW